MTIGEKFFKVAVTLCSEVPPQHPYSEVPQKELQTSNDQEVANCQTQCQSRFRPCFACTIRTLRHVILKAESAAMSMSSQCLVYNFHWHSTGKSGLAVLVTSKSSYGCWAGQLQFIRGFTRCKCSVHEMSRQLMQAFRSYHRFPKQTNHIDARRQPSNTVKCCQNGLKANDKSTQNVPVTCMSSVFGAAPCAFTHSLCASSVGGYQWLYELRLDNSSASRGILTSQVWKLWRLQMPKRPQSKKLWLSANRWLLDALAPGCSKDPPAEVGAKGRVFLKALTRSALAAGGACFHACKRMLRLKTLQFDLYRIVLVSSHSWVRTYYVVIMPRQKLCALPFIWRPFWHLAIFWV